MAGEWDEIGKKKWGESEKWNNLEKKMVRAPRGGPGDRKKRTDSREVLEAKMTEVDDGLGWRQWRTEKVKLISGFRMDREAIF